MLMLCVMIFRMISNNNPPKDILRRLRSVYHLGEGILIFWIFSEHASSSERTTRISKQRYRMGTGLLSSEASKVAFKMERTFSETMKKLIADEALEICSNNYHFFRVCARQKVDSKVVISNQE